MRSPILPAFIAVIACPALAQQPAASANVRIHDSLVVMPDGRSFAPGLQQLRLHGMLGPYLVLSGFGCNDCDAVRSIYVLRFGERLNWSRKPWPPVFAYPGTVRDTDNHVVARSRLFLGQCGPDSTTQVIQFAHVLARDEGWTDSTHVAALRKDSIVRSNSIYEAEQLGQVMEKVRGGVCAEVPGNEHQVEP